MVPMDPENQEHDNCKHRITRSHWVLLWEGYRCSWALCQWKPSSSTASAWTYSTIRPLLHSKIFTSKPWSHILAGDLGDDPAVKVLGHSCFTLLQLPHVLFRISSLDSRTTYLPASIILHMMAMNTTSLMKIATQSLLQITRYLNIAFYASIILCTTCDVSKIPSIPIPMPISWCLLMKMNTCTHIGMHMLFRFSMWMWSIVSILQYCKLPQLVSMSSLFVGSVVTPHLQAGLQNACSALNFLIIIAFLTHSDSWTLTQLSTAFI